MGERRYWWLLGAITALGLALRIANAQGALWLDEAWSAVQAQEAGTPMGVFLGINHDNNHHLNSLWMRAMGPGASPMVQRGLAIVTGTLAIPAIWMLCVRSGGWIAAAVAAMLMAVLPFFLAYGSEARGYAPMMFALLVVMIHTDRWLADEERPNPAVSLLLWSVLGVLSQLTMVVGLAAVGGWAAFVLYRRHGVKRGAMLSLRTFGPALAAAGLVVAGIVLIARLNAGGMRFGALAPYSFDSVVHGLAALSDYSIGVPIGPIWPVAVPFVLLAVGTALRVPRLPFHWLALIGLPLAILLLQPANSGPPRYYYIVAIAIVILCAELAAKRRAALAVVAAIVVASLVEDMRLIADQRADVGRAIMAMRERSPDGAAVLVDPDNMVPVVALAGKAHRYPLRITQTPCPTPRFLFLDRYDQDVLPAAEQRCGNRYTPIAQARSRGMTPGHWQLYERR
jgi:uncharacterized membrane protein